MVAEVTRNALRAESLGGGPDHAGDAEDRAPAPAFPFGGGFRSEGEHRLVESNLRISDGELRGVHPDRYAAGTGIEMVSSQGPLAPPSPPRGHRRRLPARWDLGVLAGGAGPRREPAWLCEAAGCGSLLRPDFPECPALLNRVTRCGYPKADTTAAHPLQGRTLPDGSQSARPSQNTVPGSRNVAAAPRRIRCSTAR